MPVRTLSSLLLLALCSCGSVRRLERIEAYDGARWRLFSITSTGEAITIQTRESRDDPFDERCYPFTEKERKDVAEILNKHGFLSHRDSYQPLLIEVHDGETLTIQAQYDGKEKEIYCNNKIPSGLRRICREIIAYFKDREPLPSVRDTRP